MYKKRPGTSGIQGQLYETKLLSLIYFRATHNDGIEEFNLATNIDEIGTFDDICFKAKVKGFEKPIAVFIQAKHREGEKVVTLNSKNDLAKYFDSYLKIRRAFDPNNTDVLFRGKFDETACFFAMYTTAKDDPHNNIYEGNFADDLNELIGTADSCSQACYKIEDIEFLCKIVLKEEITTLAEHIAKFICDEADCEMSMNNDLMLRYHVLLAQKVFDISEIQPEGHRIASFRPDFFKTNDEFLVVIKNTLSTEILRKRKIDETEIQCLLLKFISGPSEITLSKLIGRVITYKNDRFELVGKTISEDFKRQMDKVKIPQSTVNHAIELAAKELLSTANLKVPAAFGNKDLAVRGKDEKIEKRLNYVTSKIVDLLEKSQPNNIVTIDESMGDGFLQLNGGIASAAGNLFVFDDNSKLMKFRDNCESLGELAKRLFEKLESKIYNLHEYRFDVKVKKFPKLSFDRSEYDENLVKDFYSKLLFYANQADQCGVEEILKREIENHPCNDVNNFRVRSDAIFLKYHDEVQKLWMIPKVGPYLTKKSKIYEDAVNNTMSEPLIGVLNMMHKIKSRDYTFNENALKPFQLHQHLQTIIVSKSSALTVAKIEQYLGNIEHVVLDLQYMAELPPKAFNTLCSELTNTNKEKTLIIVCNSLQHSRSFCKRLEAISKSVDGKKIVIITDKISIEIMTEHFSQANVMNDKIRLTDMSIESQRKILETSKVTFQGDDLNLDLIVDDESARLIEDHVLNKVINNDSIVIGKPISNLSYDKVKHFYIDRRVSRNIKQEQSTFDDVKNKVLGSLFDLKDDIVLLTAIPGMGKSTLLTHLALKTKKLDPKVWIVRINLLEYTRVFSKWQKDETVIDNLESLMFMCQAALSEECFKANEEKIELEESNSIVSLKHCTGDDLTIFELKLFLYFYNRGKLIFIFDGFDEIFPHYANQALSLIKIVRNYPRQHRTWITSRSYNHIKSILEQEFGPSYELEHFTRTEQDTYLYTFWKSKIPLEKLNDDQLSNVYDFVNFIQDLIPKSGKICVNSKLQRMPYFKVYMNFLDYLKMQSVATGIDYSYAEYNSFIRSDDTRNIAFAFFFNEFTAPPLHLYLLADYFHNKIKCFNKQDSKWDLDISTYIIYEYFLETKLKKIRFQQKNKIDVYNPDNMMSYEKERTEFIAKHKKLGAYAMFYPNVDDIFGENELKEIKDMIDVLSNGREKTGFIRSVANDIPLFIHMSFAEYFAVEYICDLLKNEKSEEKQKLIWLFIINVMFFKCDINLFDIFNTKIKMDKDLSDVIERNKKIIFTVLSRQKNSGVIFKSTVYQTIEMKNREIDFEIDRLHMIISVFSALYENNIDENSSVDFNKFFNFFCIRGVDK